MNLTCTKMLRSLLFRQPVELRLFPQLRLFSENVRSIPVLNAKIQFETMRVVHGDQSKIMTKSEALKMAKELKMDLMLVRPEADPPVCKIIDYDAMMKDKNKKEKEEKIKAKAKEMREIHLGANIGEHDMEIKIKKIKEFFGDKIEVKVIIEGDKKTMEKFPECMDRTTLRFLEKIEPLVSSIKQPAVRTLHQHRKDFILSPK